MEKCNLELNFSQVSLPNFNVPKEYDLDTYLDKAYLAGMPFVRIIHGKGTGKLRQEVRAALKENAQVASFEEGHPNEGGDGVTVARIIKD